MQTSHRAFTFHGTGLVIAGNAVILGGDGDRFKTLHEAKASFEKIIEWVAPEDVPAPRFTFLSLQP